MWIYGETPPKLDYPKNLPQYIYCERNVRKMTANTDFLTTDVSFGYWQKEKKVVCTCALSTYSLASFALPGLEIFLKKIESIFMDLRVHQ